MTGVKIKQLKPEPPTPLNENQEQRAVVKWVRSHPIIAPYLLKLNNEGKRTESQGYHLKLMGMLPGASDLFLAYPAGGRHGLWLEMKCNKNYSPSQRQTNSWKAQEAFLTRMRAVGYQGTFCYGEKDAIKVIELYLAGVVNLELR